MTPFEMLCGLAVILFVLYYYLTFTFDYWKIRGVAGPKPVPIFGTASDVMRAKYSIGDYMFKLYKKYKNEPFVGIFLRSTPVLIVKDLDFCKDVLIKNFPEFASRGMTMHEKVEPLGQHLFALEPERWRPLRTKLSPVFTSGKMKQMFYLLLECAEVFEKYISEISEKCEIVDVRDLTAKFSTDVIGSCAFGLKTNAISDEESEFRKMGKRAFQVDRSKFIKALIREGMPWLFNFLAVYCRIDMADRELHNFFVNSIKQTVKLRESSKVLRHDFVDLLVELKNDPRQLGDIEFTDEFMASQAFVFFAAGFETSSTTMSNALYEMAQNIPVQDKVRLEMNEQIKKDGGKLTYDGIKNMKYLDMVVQETLRKYPPLPFLMRQTTTDYTFNGTKLTIPKGQIVWIPINGIQRDPNIFPKPDYFDPERFTPEAIASRHPMCHLPFGDGPRNCIGMRLGLCQTKVGLIKILQNHKVEVCKQTQIPYLIDNKSFFMQPLGGKIYLKLTK